jgi:regulator of replication initiation timing
MIDTSQLTVEQLELVEKYRVLYDRVGSLKLRMEILKQELTDSIEEIQQLRLQEEELFNNIENENNG